MEPRPGKVKPGLRPLRLLAVGLTLALLLLVLLAGGYWLEDHVPAWVFWYAALIGLIVAGVVYAAAAVAAFAAVPVCAAILFRRGVRLRDRPWAARGLVLGVALMVGVLVAEAASFACLARSHRRSIAGVNNGPVMGPAPATSPPEIALPTRFPEAADLRAINLVVVGESSAEGVPFHQRQSVGHVVAWQLEQAMPGRAVKCHVVAASGDTLQGQHEKLSRLGVRPDALILYCGHNEFAARFPHDRDIDWYPDADLPTAREVLIERACAASAFLRLVGENVEKCRIAIPPPEQSPRPLVDTPAFTAVEHARLLRDFRRRLEILAEFAARCGAIPVFVVPPANDSAFEPNRSYLPADTLAVERDRFGRDVLAAGRLEESDPDRAEETYRALIDRQPGFALAHFRLARLLERRSARDEAYRRDVLARDADGYPVRCLTDFQDVYRQVAADHDGILIDSQDYFRRIAPRGLLDDSLFHDGMHPSLRGQIALAQAILRGLRERGAFGWPEGSPEPVIDPAACAVHFKLDRDAWAYVCEIGHRYYVKAAGATYDPAPRRARSDQFVRARDLIESGEPPEVAGMPGIGIPAPVPLVPYGRRHSKS